MSDSDSKKFTDVARLRTPERLERLEVERVLALCLENKAVHTVLDIGTGSGVFAEAFAGRGLEVAGIDENDEMLAAARSFVPQASFEQASAEELPFKDGQFDLVFLGMVFHEVDDRLKTLKEARRAGKSRIAMLEWRYREEEVGPPLAHRLKPEEIKALAEQTGFSQVEEFPLSQLVLYRLDF
ncbi:MAG TPA: class I SAM-dependent methyltransferase [Chloroflexia bacterium]|nr:class I SAM-dependent methyltransferase [Chloroflexia bacterium]